MIHHLAVESQSMPFGKVLGPALESKLQRTIKDRADLERFVKDLDYEVTLARGKAIVVEVLVQTNQKK